MTTSAHQIHSEAEAKTGPLTDSQFAGIRLQIWLLTNAPSPYQSELLSAISDRSDLELDVRFLQAGSRAGRAASQRYRSRTLWSPVPQIVPEEVRFHPRAIWECATGRKDCYVLSGLYTSVTFLACAFLLTVRRVPWVVWFERPRPETRKEAGWSPRWLMARPIRWLRNSVQRLVLRHAKRVICIGTAAKEAYASRGVPDDRMDVLPYCCDLTRYLDADRVEGDRIRANYQLEGATVFLYSGQMIERKGVDVLLAAFEGVAAQSPNVSLILLGDGPLREQYEASVPQELSDRIHFAGHVPQSDLPGYFLAADVFVFPSRHDGWGVVINEACAAGLPIIATNQTGAAQDLIEDGLSGFLLERDDVSGFAKAMRYLLDHPAERTAFGNRARELVERFSPERGAERFQRAVKAASQK